MRLLLGFHNPTMSKLLIRSSVSLRANYKLFLEFPVASLTSPILAWKSGCMYCLVFGVMTMASFWRKDSILVGNFYWVVRPETFSHYFLSLIKGGSIQAIYIFVFRVLTCLERKGLWKTEAQTSFKVGEKYYSSY